MPKTVSSILLYISNLDSHAPKTIVLLCLAPEEAVRWCAPCYGTRELLRRDSRLSLGVFQAHALPFHLPLAECTSPGGKEWGAEVVGWWVGVVPVNRLKLKFGSNGFLMNAVQPGSQQVPLWSN